MQQVCLFALTFLLFIAFGSYLTVNCQTIQDDIYVVPITKALVPEYGSLVLTPQVYYFNTSYTSSSLQYSYLMSDGSSLKSGMSFTSGGTFTFYPNPSQTGQLNIQRNVSYYNSDNKFTIISHTITIQVLSTPSSNSNQLTLLFSDDFTSDLSKWSLLDGTMKIQSSQLNLYQNNTRIAIANSFDNSQLLTGITWTFNLLSSWTSMRGIIIHVDSLNYYEINLSTSPLTIKRYLNGQLSVVLQSTKLLQVHASNYYSSYKLFLQLTKNGIVINLAKIGTLSSDYLLNVIDNFTNMDVFKSVKLGFFDKSTSSPTQSTFKVLQCQVYSGKVIHTRQSITYHVDGKNGNDSNDGLTKSTALKTLNTAQYQLLPDDTLLVYDSVYRESLQINRETTIDHPITIKAVNQPTTTSTFTTTPYTHTAIIDGSLVLDNSKFTKISNTNIYQTRIKFTPDVVYMNNVKMSLAMKPLPKDLQDEYLPKNYIHPINDSTVSSDNLITYLQLDDMFKYDSLGNRAPDNYWNGGDLYHYYLAANVVFTRRIVSYNASTNTIGLVYKDSVWGNLIITTTDYYAIGNHVGCFSQVGQYVSFNNQIYVSLANDPSQYTSDQLLLEVSAVPNGIRFVAPSFSSIDGISIQGLMVRKFVNDGILCSTQGNNLNVLNCSTKYNGGSGVSFLASSNILVDGGEHSQNYNNGVNFGGGMKNSIVQNTYTHDNINNGIWVGNGGPLLFYCWNILLKSNKVGPQISQRLHPDNIQFASVHNITLDSNILSQPGAGDQNMWMEQNGLVIFRRNIFLNGPLGINHAQHLIIENNIFYQSWMRYSFKFENFVPYSSLVGLESVVSWSEMFNSLNNSNSNDNEILSNQLVWNGLNSQISNRIKSYSSYSLLTSQDKNDLVSHINTIINNTQFMKLYKDKVLPLLDKSNVALPYWNAITKRGLLDSTTGQFNVVTSDISIIEEVRGLTRAILDELVFDGILDKSLMTFYPRIVSIKNNAIISSNLQYPNASYSLLPYWDTDYNYIQNANNFQANLWKKNMIGPNTIFESALTNVTLYFKNVSLFDFHLNCNQNISLIDKGVNVGESYYGQSPDIGAYESNCNNGNIVNPQNSPKPSTSSVSPQISPKSSKSSPQPNSSRIVSNAQQLIGFDTTRFIMMMMILIIGQLLVMAW